MRSHSSPSSSCCDAKKLVSISFIGALIYIAYVVFYEGSGGGDIPDMVGLERSAHSSLRAAPLISTDTDAVPAMDTVQSTVTYPQGPVIYGEKGQVTSVNLLGERHSGTNWITDHLVDCVS